MAGDFTGGPKFPGDLTDRLPPRPPGHRVRWADRFRRDWVPYAFLAAVGAVWLVLLVVAYLQLGARGPWSLTMVTAFMVLGTYNRVVVWRMVTGRDPDTGQRFPPRDR